MSNETPWFPGDVKPAHVGLYQRNGGPYVYWSGWNGTFWGTGAFREEDAVTWRNEKSLCQSLPWRGLKTQEQAE